MADNARIYQAYLAAYAKVRAGGGATLSLPAGEVVEISAACALGVDDASAPRTIKSMSEVLAEVGKMTKSPS